MSLDDLPPMLRRGQPARPTRSPATVSRNPRSTTIVAGYELGAYRPARRLIAELDGADYHQDVEADRAKDAGLLEAGYRVVRLTRNALPGSVHVRLGRYS